MIGTRIGKYEILRLLGEGGMGRVYLARDATLNRDVALKVLRSEAEDPDQRERLLREAQAAAALDHPNICAVYEVGEDTERRYIAMQYVEGETLDARLRRQRFSSEETLEIAAQVADALAAAHTHGIIHRDIKPSNIMLTARGLVKVLDFGLAKSMSDRAGDLENDATASLLTRPGVTVGTAPYMSPEQVRGEPLDARSDVFSFGLMVHEMLTGRRAFQRGSAAETIAAILSPQPVDISADLVGMPVELERIVRKCLAKDRERRYQATRDLVIDLQSLQRERALQASPPEVPGVATSGAPGQPHGAASSSGAVPRWHAGARQAWWPVLTMVAIVSLVAVGVALMWGRWGGGGVTVEAPIQSLAVLPLENLSGDASQEYLADGMTDAVTNELSKVETLSVISRSAMMGYKGTRKAIQEIARELHVDAVAEGTVSRSGDRVSIRVTLFRGSTGRNLWAQSYERDLTDKLALQSEVARGIVSEIRVKLTPGDEARLSRARPIDRRAQEKYLQGLYYLDRAINAVSDVAAYESSFQAFQDAIAIDPTFAEAHAGLAAAYHWAASSLPAREYYPKGKAAAAEAIRLDDALPSGHDAMAYIVANYDWDNTTAEAEYRRAIELDPGSGAHFGYGILLSELGRHDEAIREIELAARLDPVSLPLKGWVARIHTDAGQVERAIAEFDAIIEQNPDSARPYELLAIAYAYVENYERCIDETLAAVALRNEDPRTSVQLAWANAVAGRRDAATQILAALERPTDPALDGIYAAAVYAALRQPDEAFAALERAYASRVQWLRTIKTARIWDNLRADERFPDLLRRAGFID